MQKKRKTDRRSSIAVIISGMPSVGKTTAANVIANRFDLKHIAGGDMLKEMAILRGYNPTGPAWWDSDEGMAFLAERKTNPDFDREVDRRLIEYVIKGGYVITSYTVPWLSDDGLKLWFAASSKSRAKRLAGRDKISFKKAMEIIHRRDIQNQELYSQLYQIRFGKDLKVFNYVIDTEDMNAREVADAAAKLVENYKNYNKKE